MRVRVACAPWCHKCAWDGRGMIGKALEQRTVSGEMDTGASRINYTGSVDLCQLCAGFWDVDVFFRLAVSTQAIKHISGVK